MTSYNTNKSKLAIIDFISLFFNDDKFVLVVLCDRSYENYLKQVEKY